MKDHQHRSGFSISMICLLFVVFSFLGCGGGSSSGGSTTAPEGAATGPSIGPLAGAEVKVFRYDDFETAIYATTTSESLEFYEIGLFDIPNNVLEDTPLYVVTISGGKDVDTDDDGLLDPTPTDNLGTLHLVGLGSRLKSGHYSANILTDIVYHKVSYLILAGYPAQTIQDEMDRYSKTLLKADIDGDGDRDSEDLLIWNPAVDKDKTAFDWPFYQECIHSIHNDSVYAERLNRIKRNIMGMLDTEGALWDLQLSGNYIYAADGTYGLHVIDISDPFTPKVVSIVETYNDLTDSLSGNARKVKLYRNYVYLVDVDYRLNIIDIMDPSNPSIVAELPGRFRTLTFSGDYAYAADYSGLTVIDISDPTQPIVASSANTNSAATDVALSGNYAYVQTYYHGLQVIDISDPFNPAIVNAMNASGTLEVLGNYLYLLGEYCGGLQAIDISDPRNLGELKQVDAEGIGHVSNILFNHNLAYVPGIDGLKVFEIITPYSMIFRGVLETPGFANAVSLSDDRAYVADDIYGLQVIDLSELTSPPAIIGAVDTLGEARDVAVRGDYAYVSDTCSGLQVVDISNPSFPVIAGEVATQDYAWSVSVSDTIAAVAAGYSGLHLIDISDPSVPTILDAVDTVGPAIDVKLFGDYAYLAETDARLHVIDISDPTNGFLEGTANTCWQAQDVEISGNYAYLACEQSGLQVIDISDPRTPEIAGLIDLSGLVIDIELSGKYAYIVNTLSGLQVVDISNPETPGVVATVDFTFSSHHDYLGGGINAEYGIGISGNYAYVAGGHSGLHVFDIRNPNSPFFVSTLDTIGAANNVAISGDYIYVANNRLGLTVYRAIHSTKF